MSAAVRAISVTPTLTFTGTTQDNQTFDYLAHYNDLLDRQDYTGIISLNHALGRIKSYAEGLGLSLE